MAFLEYKRLKGFAKRFYSLFVCCLCSKDQLLQFFRSVTLRIMDFVWLIGYFRQFLSVAVGLPHMAEFCTVLHQALDVAIVSQKIEKIHI